MAAAFEGGEIIMLRGHRAVLVDGLSYMSKAGHEYHVPAGFEYDGASIPDFAWSIVGHPFMNGYIRPSALHDYLVINRWHTSQYVHNRLFEALRVEKVAWWRAKTMHLAVNRFGPKW